MNSFNSAKFYLKGGNPKGRVEIYFMDEKKDTTIFVHQGRMHLLQR